MSNEALKRRLNQLIEEVENHKHRDELLELMSEQLCEMVENCEK